MIGDQGICQYLGDDVGLGGDESSSCKSRAYSLSVVPKQKGTGCSMFKAAGDSGTRQHLVFESPSGVLLTLFSGQSRAGSRGGRVH
jgi:hypothetical protein